MNNRNFKRMNQKRVPRRVKAVAKNATFQIQLFVITLWAMQFIGLVLFFNQK